MSGQGVGLRGLLGEFFLGTQLEQWRPVRFAGENFRGIESKKLS